MYHILKANKIHIYLDSTEGVSQIESLVIFVYYLTKAILFGICKEQTESEALMHRLQHVVEVNPITPQTRLAKRCLSAFLSLH